MFQAFWLYFKISWDTPHMRIFYQSVSLGGDIEREKDLYLVWGIYQSGSLVENQCVKLETYSSNPSLGKLFSQIQNL